MLFIAHYTLRAYVILPPPYVHVKGCCHIDYFYFAQVQSTRAEEIIDKEKCFRTQFIEKMQF